LAKKRFLVISIKIFISGLVLSLITLVPLTIKWELDKKLALPATFFIGIISWVLAEAITAFWDLSLFKIVILQIFIIGALSISLLLWRFYRDPERVPPEGENTILSPADGTIIYVKEMQDDEIPFSEKNGRKFPLHDFVKSNVLKPHGQIIGILLTYLDVHVNRAPIGGRVSLLKHIKGGFLSLKKTEAVFQNERAFVVIDNGDFNVGIVLIASRLVRKIVTYIQEGQKVQRGERIGMIRFGSQVDLILPNLPLLRIQVAPGEKVKAGASILATFEK
jgi:phosphatidylserine decarboxylase